MQIYIERVKKYIILILNYYSLKSLKIGKQMTKMKHINKNINIEQRKTKPLMMKMKRLEGKYCIEYII